jgi:Cu(I)/Ag(I) efflux system membrane fusion protein
MNNKTSVRFIVAVLIFVMISFSQCTTDTAKTETAIADSTEELYTCSMHPQVLEHAPGNCPICGMTLVKKENANREISTIDLSTLLEPTNQTVISSIPVTSMQFTKQQVSLDAVGSVEYDTRFMKTISARVSGRIEKLYIKYRYQPIRVDDKVMDIYSPELLTGEQNLLFLIKNDPSNNSLINAAKQRLLLLGMNSNQVQHVVATGQARPEVTIYSNYSGHVHEAGAMMNASQPVNASNETGELSIKEGMYVERGQPVFQVNNMDNVWVRLNFFARDDALIKVGTPVTIIPETSPDEKIMGRVNFVEPFYRSESKTITARVYFDNAKLMLPVGSQVKAFSNTNTTFKNWLPQESVLDLWLNKIVFLKKENFFIAHSVKAGIVANKFIEILDGLNDKDSVAANAQFLIDSEGFIKTKQKK